MERQQIGWDCQAGAYGQAYFDVTNYPDFGERSEPYFMRIYRTMIQNYVRISALLPTLYSINVEVV